LVTEAADHYFLFFVLQTMSSTVACHPKVPHGQGTGEFFVRGKIWKTGKHPMNRQP
jgi:hypothetical protein